MSLVDNTSQPAEGPLDRQRRQLKQRAFLNQAVCFELEASAGDYGSERVSIALYFVQDWIMSEYDGANSGSHSLHYYGLYDTDIALEIEAEDSGLLAEVRAGARVLGDAQLLRWANSADYDNDLQHIATSLNDYLTLRGLPDRPHSL